MIDKWSGVDMSLIRSVTYACGHTYIKLVDPSIAHLVPRFPTPATNRKCKACDPTPDRIKFGCSDG